VKFRVKVGSAVAPTTIRNRAVAAFQAASGGVDAPAVSVQSNEVTSDVVAPTVDLDVPDLSEVDLAAADDLMSVEADLATSEDLAVADDLSMVPDDLSSVDQLVVADLAISRDGTFTGADLTDTSTGASKGGCGCTTTPQGDAEGAAMGLLLLVAVAVVRARREKACHLHEPA
jgi:MYXO-CTERM domain-containing protein